MAPKPYRHTASFGARQEHIAIAELLRRGFDVYRPLVDDQGIDCIIRKEYDKYLEVQIKARSKDCISIDAARFAAMEIPEAREHYFFIFYCETLDTYWVMPSMKLVELANRNRTGKHAGKYHLNLTGCKQGKVYALPRFDEYRNNFESLRT